MAQAQVSTGSTHRHSEAFVDSAWLIQRLDDPSVRVVEVDVSAARYKGGHIPGAVLWNAYTDLHHSDYSPAGPEELAALLSKSGVTPETTVVFYGYAPYLGFWQMKSLGHERARVLDATRDSWQAAQFPLTAETSQVQPTAYPLPAARQRSFASLESTRAAVGRAGHLILDMRTQAEYDGDRFWPSGATEGAGRAGHIPGALHLPVELLREENGSLKSSAEIREVVRGLGIDSGRSIITYCTIGGRATEAWFALTELLEFDEVRVYAGGWANWGTTDGTPIEPSVIRS